MQWGMDVWTQWGEGGLGWIRRLACVKYIASGKMLHSTVNQLGALCRPRGVGSGWAGGGRLKGEGYVTDSLYCTVEANSIVEQLYSNKRIIPLKNLTLNFIWNKTWFQIKMLSCVWSTVSCAHLTCVFIQRDFFPSAACKTFPSSCLPPGNLSRISNLILFS